jgi:outer membrane protein assembly factor BamE (lipoprotein component of BamABCDE complex)
MQSYRIYFTVAGGNMRPLLLLGVRKGMGMNKKQLIIVGVVVSLMLTGCATSGVRIDQDKVAQIKENVTTEQEVIRLLGSPYTKTLSSDGKIMMFYQYTKVKNRASNFIPIMNLMTGGMDMQQQMLTVLIGKNGKVEKYTLNDSATAVNSGIVNTN